MRNAFHDDLDRVSDQLVLMTRMVGVAIERATEALVNADLGIAESVIAADDDIDTVRREVDDLAVDLLARQQPVATDLRMVVTAMHMASDIERMGDLARHIAKIARMRYPKLAVPEVVLPNIKSMSECAIDLAKQTGAAIDSKDVHAALEIERSDDRMDDLHRQIFAALHDEGWDQPTETAVDMTLLSRYYERFGDHAVAVANRIVYLVTGRYGDADEGLQR
ncbi:phosphate signaling complex protein PhoU [Yimella sp. cx-51]|uniref:phosphate signaling complex protein PhoU n=1 Tax=Yimella sp. cx-51 TaxID=2770551 RepID=UPI00165E1893|nr:phosphate signaling complex protein PhoU [Yimella sp. cx-51]MBC9955786.1 phosphate signaling complex protein PhoU [Yimella sp. cx-51]QTH37658.1 phosphate signaling complex protein PhoU [Yimella sp. cx-51]